VSEETIEKKPRTNKIAQEKARLRAELAALANKVPEKVNAGSIQTTQEWLKENGQLQTIAGGGLQRLSRRALEQRLAKMKGWHQ
jgi:hypothetical protein